MEVLARRPKTNMLGTFSRYRTDLGVVALLAGLVLVFFWKHILGQVSLPFDVVDFHFPLLFSQTEAFKDGFLPLWDPYLYSGNPNIANPQAAIFYPPNLLLYLLGAVRGGLTLYMVEWQLFIHFFLAGLFTYLLGRNISLEPFGSLIAAIVYMFGGFFVSQTQHLGVLNAATWIPLIFLLLLKVFQSQAFGWAALASIPLALNILAGNPPSAAVLFVVLFFLFIYLQCRYLVEGAGLGKMLRFTALFAMVLFLAVAMAAVQLLPTFEFLARLTAIYPGGTAAPCSADTLVTFFVPDFFASASWPEGYWGRGDITLEHYYLGIFSLLLALIGLLFTRRKETTLYAFLAVFSFLWWLGPCSFVGRVIYLLSPALLQRSMELLLVKAFFDFAIAVLAGFGAKLLISPFEQQRRQLLILSGLLLALALSLVLILTLFEDKMGIYLYHAFGGQGADEAATSNIVVGLDAAALLLTASAGFLFMSAQGFYRREVIVTLALCLVIGDLFAFGANKKFNTSEKPPEFFIGSDYVYGGAIPIIHFLQKAPDYQTSRHYRIYIDQTTLRAEWDNGPRIWRLSNIGGGEPLILNEYIEFRNLFSTCQMRCRLLFISDLNSPLLDLLGVKYIVTTRGLEEIDPSVEKDKFEEVFNNWYRVFENKTFLPRAFLVHRVKVVEDGEQVLRELGSDRFNPREYIVLDSETSGRLLESGAVPSLFSGWGAASVEGEEVRIVQYQPNKTRLEVSLEADGFLFMSEVFYPGWKALVDGKESPILKANYIFRAVFLEAGTHTIEFIYDPLSFKVGLMVTIIALAFMIGVFIFHIRQSVVFLNN